MIQSTHMDDLVKRLKDNPHFQELQQYIFSKIDELNSIEGLNGMTNEQAGEEARARAKAIEKLEDILRPFLEFAEKREPSEKEIEDAKRRRGL